MGGTPELEPRKSFVEALLYKKHSQSSSTFYSAVASSHLWMSRSGMAQAPNADQSGAPVSQNGQNVVKIYALEKVYSSSVTGSRGAVRRNSTYTGRKHLCDTHSNIWPSLSSSCA